MVALNPPVCEFNAPAIDFSLPTPAGDMHTLNDCRGESGLVVMFICNHCPFVQAILPELVGDVAELQSIGVNTVAIMSNDIDAYPDDAPSKMQQLAEEFDFTFPYLFDANQSVAKAYGAICTPDFFGYNKDLELQYRGRFDDTGMSPAKGNSKHELFEAMQMIAETGQGPREQAASIGCSIKWKQV